MISIYLYIVIAIIAIAFSGVACLLGLTVPGKRILKYIPACITGIAAVGFFIKARYYSQGFEDLGYLIFAVIAGAVFILSLLTAIILEFVVKRRL